MATQLERIRKIIDLMAKNEELVGLLYEKNVQDYPGCKLWGNLAHDEFLHAKILRGLYSDVEKGTISFNQQVFQEKAILSSLKKLNKLISSPAKKSLPDALKVAFQFESEILEQKYFTIFSSDNSEIKASFKFLERETEKHSEKVYLELKKQASNG